MANKTNPKKPRTPKLRRHSNGKAFIEVKGQRRYLSGKYGDPETLSEYHALCAEVVQNGGNLLVAQEDLTVVEMLARYLGHAEEYYRKPDGGPTTTLLNIRRVAKQLKRLYGVPPFPLGPCAFERFETSGSTTG